MSTYAGTSAESSSRSPESRGGTGTPPSFPSTLRFGLVAFVVWRTTHALTVWALGGPFFRFAWDGDWYVRILDHGYNHPGVGSEKATAFMPLLPWLTRAVQVAVRSRVAAAVIVTSLAALAAVILVYRLVSIWRDERTARWVVVLFLAFPASTFLWQFYTEGLFIALAAGALLAQERRRPGLAVALAALATMTRVPGVVVAAALVAGELQRSRRLNRTCILYAAGVLGFVPVYIAQLLQAGDGLGFLTAGRPWGRHLSLPWTPVVTALRSLRHGSTVYGSPLDLAILLGFLVVVAMAFRRPWPWSARALLVGMVVVPLCSGVATSMARYMLAAWPAFAVIADRGDEAGSLVRPAVLLALAVATVPVLDSWSRGSFVG